MMSPRTRANLGVIGACTREYALDDTCCLMKECAPIERVHQCAHRTRGRRMAVRKKKASKTGTGAARAAKAAKAAPAKKARKKRKKKAAPAAAAPAAEKPVKKARKKRRKKKA